MRAGYTFLHAADLAEVRGLDVSAIDRDHGLSLGNRERLCAHVRWELQRGEAPGS